MSLSLTLRRCIAGALIGLLPSAAAVAWQLRWNYEYRGFDRCSVHTGKGHPLLLGIGLILLIAGIMMTTPSWAGISRRKGIARAIASSCLAGLVIFVLYVIATSGLGCG